MKLCKKRAQSPNFPFSSVLFGDFVTKNRYFCVTIHSVGLEILFDDFLGHIFAEKCQLAAAIDGGVPLNFDPEFQFWGTFPPKQGARKASHTIFRPTGCIALWVHSIKDF